ncbi:DUF4401 domain-containing protein [Litoribrevibacter albus]|uniref:DUF4401 domain-containing protein n=1 Tax=Litoribrevibacter albus TaxID=1473156 RepID=A0AA37S943_9GAMM|nr:DUF4401 domain-containing protein [Litoribrevibacter albus]GLQ30846.1 hypothetical protein GCM10007876_13250 [Litoribrevibacter albus]
MKSKSDQRRQLWERLSSQGLTQGELNELPLQSNPWFVKTLMAFSGWLAALFLMGFISIALEFIIENMMISFFTGAGLIALSFSMLAKVERERLQHRVSKQEFLEHLALAISLAGQILIGIAIFDFVDDVSDSDVPAIIAFGVLQAILSVIMPNYLHRLLSAFTAVFFWYFACVVRNSGLNGVETLLVPAVLLGVCWVWLNEFRLTQRFPFIQPIAYGATLALVYIKGSLMFSQHSLVWYMRDTEELVVDVWVGELATTLVLLYAVTRLLQSQAIELSSPKSMAAIVGCLLAGAISFESYGISLGVLIILLGFHNSNRLLMAVGVVSMLFYISSYYYFLDVTLLVKSFTLLGIGAVLLSGRWMMLKKWGA